MMPQAIKQANRGGVNGGSTGRSMTRFRKERIEERGALQVPVEDDGSRLVSLRQLP